MKTKKFLLVLIPVFAFILVGCGGLFNGDDEAEIEQDALQDDLLFEMEETIEPTEEGLEFVEEETVESMDVVDEDTQEMEEEYDGEEGLVEYLPGSVQGVETEERTPTPPRY